MLAGELRHAAPALSLRQWFNASVGGLRWQVRSYGEAAPAEAALTDLRLPASWYPAARAGRRTVVAHVGGTNSGKTHAALAALARAESGVYCAPLRLLAWEVAHKLNSGGVACDLVTGQERREVAGSRHVACTVEMASTTRRVEVGVVDEVQMVADARRGWSWTRALLGLPCETLHVCGDPAALPLLEAMCAEAGDTLQVLEYERLAPLRTAGRPLRSLAAVGRGDAVVAFSRRRVHALRRQVEAAGRHKCSVVYGALPPEARHAQAHLFNTKRTGYNVLAASDAIGLGLNLAIRRVVLTATEKYDGVALRPLSVAEVKQIAGRAGRYGSRWEEGVVTCLDQADLEYVSHALHAPSEPLTAAALTPRYEQLAMLASQLPEGTPLPDLLDAFAARATLAPHYALADISAVERNAALLAHLPLRLPDAWAFAIAPADPDDPPAAGALLRFATAYCLRGQVPDTLIGQPPLQPARSEGELLALEETHRVLDLYLWLSFRFAEAFADRQAVHAARRLCAALVQQALRDGAAGFGAE